VSNRRILLFVLASLAAPPTLSAQSGLVVEFAESADFDFRGAAPPDLADTPFTQDEKNRIVAVIADVEARARALLPGLPEQVRVTVTKVNRDLSSVGGASGRADAPGEVLVELSATLDGGSSAQSLGLHHTLFHEFHHLARGWTIIENRFGPGIATAAVNEGLADVFAEQQTGRVLPANEYPENVREWVLEILLLPPDADYGTWMFEHPDGRRAIGYRTGRYIVHQAMENSGKTILELSEHSPLEILELARIQ